MGPKIPDPPPMAAPLVISEPEPIDNEEDQSELAKQRRLRDANRSGRKSLVVKTGKSGVNTSQGTGLRIPGE